ncbi:TPA: epimerase, partial [Enterococcus faecium]
LNDLIHTIDQLLDTKIAINYQDERAGDIRYSLANIERLTSLNFRQKYSLLDGMKKYLKFELNN